MKAIKTLLLTTALLAAFAARAVPPVDVNTADAQALADAIVGVGLKRAQAIVAEREKNGPFHSVDDLARVRGIGERIIDQSRDRLTVDRVE